VQILCLALAPILSRPQCNLGFFLGSAAKGAGGAMTTESSNSKCLSCIVALLCCNAMSSCACCLWPAHARAQDATPRPALALLLPHVCLFTAVPLGEPGGGK
jgi:hypothetical protein